MPKNIVIIGGGISGLALLHYLNKKYQRHGRVDIALLEKNDRLGGTIRSIVKEGCLFETGPNGFLDSKKRTLEFVKELGLEDRLVRADKESKIRYLSVNNTLHRLPSRPQDFLAFKLLNPAEKFRVLGEFFVPKKNDPDESVYDFGKRRLGEKFSKVFLDPMVSGITGGDVRRTNLKAVFPKFYALEEEHGSLFKAMLKARKERKQTGNGTLTSFQGGTAQLIEAAGKQYSGQIRLNQDIESIIRRDDQYDVITSGGRTLTADELYLSAPAYSAAAMVKGMNPQLARALERIDYAPIAVVGLVYPMKCFDKKPEGFGYLVPSSENKEILGVLFEGNIFPGRCRNDQVFFRVMLGGARHPEIFRKTKDELVDCAVREIETLPGKKPGAAREVFFVPWAKAIPQYDLEYWGTVKAVTAALRQSPNLHLAANYLNGVSLNDCIENAYQSAQRSSIRNTVEKGLKQAC